MPHYCTLPIAVIFDVSWYSMHVTMPFMAQQSSAWHGAPIVWLSNHGAVHQWHGCLIMVWCTNGTAADYLCCSTLSHGMVPHDAAPPCSCCGDSVGQNLQICTHEDYCLGCSGVQFRAFLITHPPSRETLHHVRELWAGIEQQHLHSVILAPEHHKSNQSL